ncbi:hypothetical protein SUGI_0610770 [Cryptomeria japonica]|nr:hypothetical protein SUGI_0610770 [Cryptomeria japonica]
MESIFQVLFRSEVQEATRPEEDIGGGGEIPDGCRGGGKSETRETCVKFSELLRVSDRIFGRSLDRDQ